MSHDYLPAVIGPHAFARWEERATGDDIAASYLRAKPEREDVDGSVRLYDRAGRAVFVVRRNRRGPGWYVVTVLQGDVHGRRACWRR